METVTVPAGFLGDRPSDEPVLFVPYTSHKAIIKGRASLEKHMISLITEGEKIIYIDNEKIHLTPERVMLLAAGNALFTERLGGNAQIRSTMIFFDDQVLQSALDQFSKDRDLPTMQRPYLLVERDDYLRGYIESVRLLIEQGLMTSPLQRAKLVELLAYLHRKHPGLLDSLRVAAITLKDEERLRRIMEAHAHQQLTLAELAFLCHMSLPTFKRKFEQVYQKSPARWLQIQRLTLAADQLRSRKAKPGEVYLEAGYESHSSFSKAFRQYFGVLPKDYAH